MVSEAGAEEARRDGVAGRGSGAPSERSDGVSEAGAGEARRDGVAGRGSGASSERSDGVSGGDLDAVGRVRGFRARQGGDVVAVIEHLGRAGARIVLVASDGRFGDVLVSSVRAAEQVCERAGVPVGQWDRNLSARVTPTPADRLRMASRAR